MAIKGRVPPARGGTLNGLTAVTPGAEALGRVRVSEIQRARMLAAMVEVVSERGAANATVAHVVARSAVSRRTFYEIFTDREDCFLAAFDDVIGKIAAVVLPAYEREDAWRERVRAGLTALLQFLDDDFDSGRLVIVETLAAGPRALVRRRQVLERIIAVVDGGRGQARSGEGPPPLAAEGTVGAVLSVLHARLLARGLPGTGDSAGENGVSTVGELVNPLMSMIVLPYLGASAARKELARAVSRPASRPKTGGHDALRKLDMRLTYRTVRVLSAVAAHPGSSNRTVAEASDIVDQGQISKLLTRLHGLELIENVGGGPARGGPNAWTLTDKGWQVHATISTQTSPT